MSFKTGVNLETKIKALGGKYEHIKNIVQENSIVWQDQHLELIETGELFGRSAEKIGEYIASRLAAWAKPQLIWRRVIEKLTIPYILV